MDEKEVTYMNLWICPKCGGKTDTLRHLNAVVWCTECGHVLRKEGDMTIEHRIATPAVEKERS